MQRTSHALLVDGKVWLVDPVAFDEALDRAAGLGEIAGVLQLLDRHNRDCAPLAERFGVPLLKVPDAVPGTPFKAIPVVRFPGWKETALWWPEHEALIVAEVVGTNESTPAAAPPPACTRCCARCRRAACAPTRRGTC